MLRNLQASGLSLQAFVPLFLPDAVQPEDRRDGFRVANGAVHNHLYGGGKLHHPLDDYFVILWFGQAGLQARSQVHGHGFSHETRAGIKLKYAAPAFGAVSGLLDQFALRSLELVFARIDAARRQFPKVITGSVTILALQQYPRDGTR